MAELYPSRIRESIQAIRADMAPFEGARLMAAVKTRTPEEIRYAVCDCGIALLGENRVQEFLMHYEALGRIAEWHFIGTLQKNKVKYIIDKVDMIESVDSASLAREIDRQAEKHQLKMPILLEVNIGREASKSGVFPEGLPELCDDVLACKSLVPMGLMTVAPICQSKEDEVRYFAEMRTLRDRIFCPKFPDAKGGILSMGMSGSYLAALSQGADIVRIGSGIFGERKRFTEK